jgi:hypothetical protein
MHFCCNEFLSLNAHQGYHRQGHFRSCDREWDCGRYCSDYSDKHRKEYHYFEGCNWSLSWQKDCWMLKSFVCLLLDFILSNRSLRLFLVVEHWDRLVGSHNFGYSEIAEDSFG